VNEGKLFREGEGPDAVAARTSALEMWLDAGHALGNHTYSHRSLNRLPLEEFQADVLRGETVTRRLLAGRGHRLRDFRHPFLQVGLELPKRRAFEAWLAARGYRVAPVTIDNDEWVYAAVYADALRRGDTAFAARVRSDYVRYMDEVFAFFEGLSRRLLGREPAQVLLVHANALNADAFGDLAAAIRRRGYRFVTLDAALRDPVYRRRDDYVGTWGISWIHHWEVTEGRPRTPSPDPPKWLTDAHTALGSAGSEGPAAWTWDRLRAVPSVSAADVAWLEQHASLADARRVGALAAELSAPESAQLLAAYAYLDGTAHLPGLDVAGPLAARPPAGEAGLVAVTAAALRARRTIDGFWAERSPGAYARGFTGRRLALDPGPEPKGAERLRFDLDPAPARTILGLLSRGETRPEEVARALDTPEFRALFAHRRQSFYPFVMTRDVFAANIAHAAAWTPPVRLWFAVNRNAFLDYADVRANLAEYERVLGELEAAEPAVVADVRRRLLPFVPDGVSVDRRVSLFFAGGADGWVAQGVAGLGLEYFKDDYGKLLDLLAHETFHVVQGAARAGDGKDTPPSPRVRAAGVLFGEGTATFVAPALRLSDEERERRVERGRVLVAGIVGGDAAAAGALVDEGVRGSGPFYWLGAEMARVIVETGGERALAETLRGGPPAFLAAFGAAARGHPDPPLDPALADALAEG
jgi:peptidoglycan/xylan/chitin deacetylase (PgdA/CDA1 family)